MSQHALSDDQVSQELKKMTAFIRKEAEEKAREIEIKADEEFAIEKSKLVRTESASIDTTYAKKFKAARMSQTISASTLANKTRLRVLSARQELLDDVFEKARTQLADLTKSGREKEHEAVLTKLVLEAADLLNEESITVRGRKQDATILGRVKTAVEKACKEKSGRKECNVEIDGKQFLGEDSAGGVIVLSGSGKIDINNTFEERLRLLQDAALPSIRESLFGKNENRKFYE